MAKYDIYHIEERLKQFDPELFVRIDFEYKRGMHKIVCYDPIEREEYIAFAVKHGELDHRAYCRYMEIHPKNGFNALEEIEKSLQEKERNEEKKVTDMARDFADMMHRPMIENYYYGG